MGSQAQRLSAAGTQRLLADLNDAGEERVLEVWNSRHLKSTLIVGCQVLANNCETVCRKKKQARVISVRRRGRKEEE